MYSPFHPRADAAPEQRRHLDHLAMGAPVTPESEANRKAAKDQTDD